MTTARQSDLQTGFTAWEFDPTAKRTSSGTPVIGLAVAYLRVSTSEQMATDYEAEGNSLQTQRDYAKSMADRMGYILTGEYIEPGNSATSISARPVFRALLARVKQPAAAAPSSGRVDAVIIYKRNRAFRNEIDAALTKKQFTDHGVRLISATDYTDDSPEGHLVAGVLDQINAYYSAASGHDIKMKMEGKAKRGGTPTRAKLGYLNIFDTIHGRQVRTITIDPDRAPLIKLLFQRYATGRYNHHQMRQYAADIGLRSRPSRKYPTGRPITLAQIATILSDHTYLGMVVYKGATYPGRHEPIIDPQLFDTVQHVTNKRRQGTRMRQWDHYLKGEIWCRRCQRRMVMENARSRNGTLHFYFRCAGLNTHECDLPRFRLADVEEAVAGHYATLTMAPHHTQQLRDAISHTLKTKNHATAQARARIKTHLTSLNHQITECANLIGHPQWPTDVLTTKVTQLQTQRDLTQHQLHSLSTTHLAHAADTIHTLTDLLQQPYQLYDRLNATQRQHLNHLLFQRLYIDTHNTDPDRTPHINHDVSDTLAPLHHHLHHTTHNTKNPAPKNSEQGSINTKMVDLLATYYNTKPQVDKAIAAINLPADLVKNSAEPTWTQARPTFDLLHPHHQCANSGSRTGQANHLHGMNAHHG